MKTLLALVLLAETTTVASAQATSTPCDSPCHVQPAPDAAQQPVAQPAVAQPAPAPATVAYAEPAQPQPIVQPAAQPGAVGTVDEDDEGWHTPPGHRFLHGFRLGYMYVSHINDAGGRPNNMSLAQQYGIKSPNMMLIGYEGFYRIVGHSWLNVLMVGNVTVAGLEQSKFLPAASGLLGFEFNRSFELGVGVNLTPDDQAPSHMIVAGGWTPRAGSIMVPFHVFYIPDTYGNTRAGATIGVNW
jgi:hypothetical protein